MALRLRRVLLPGLWLAPLALGACLPWPHASYLTPVITGTIQQEGRLGAGIALRVVAEPAEEPCEGRRVFEGISQENGRFGLCPIREGRLLLHPMAHRTFHWNVCARTEDGWLVLGSAEIYTLVDSGPRQLSEWDCTIGLAGKCEVRDDFEVTTAKARAALLPTVCPDLGRR